MSRLLLLNVNLLAGEKLRIVSKGVDNIIRGNCAHVESIRSAALLLVIFEELHHRRQILLQNRVAISIDIHLLRPQRNNISCPTYRSLAPRNRLDAAIDWGPVHREMIIVLHCDSVPQLFWGCPKSLDKEWANKVVMSAVPQLMVQHLISIFGIEVFAVCSPRPREFDHSGPRLVHAEEDGIVGGDSGCTDEFAVSLVVGPVLDIFMSISSSEWQTETHLCLVFTAAISNAVALGTLRPAGIIADNANGYHGCGVSDDWRKKRPDCSGWRFLRLYCPSRSDFPNVFRGMPLAPVTNNVISNMDHLVLTLQAGCLKESTFSTSRT